MMDKYLNVKSKQIKHLSEPGALKILLEFRELFFKVRK